MAKISFIIAEKSYLIRAGLIGIINTFRECEVVSEIVEDKHVANKISKFKPEILIINSKFLLNNPDILSENHSKKKRSKIIALITGNENSDDFRFCDKLIDIENDKSIISKTIWEVIKTLNFQDAEKNDELSEREKEIVAQVALGKTNKQIADELFISSHTVVTHRKNIVRKLGIKTVSGITVYAILNRIISINDTENQK